MKKQIWSMLLVLVITLTLVPVLETEAKAAYENTHINTGNQAHDIVAIAQTQVGYREGADNDNKYGAAFNSNNVAWCAYFISWCAKEAEISDSIIHRQGIASPFEDYFNIPNTHYGSGYFPKPGDLVFYGPNSNGDHYHVGLVETVDSSTGYITTIEGNTNSGGSSEGYTVYRHTRHYKSQKICCYGTPNYNGNDDVVPPPDTPTMSNYIEAYPLSYGNISVYTSPNGEKYSNRYITGSTDLCKIFEISDGWFHVSYPSTAEADEWFEAWVPASEFTKLESGKKWTTDKTYTMYRRSDKKDVFTSVPAGIELLETGIDGNMIQVAYQTGNVKYMGWIEVHKHSYTTSITAPTCGEQGYTTYTCSCGDSYKDNYTKAADHKPITIEGKAATCTKSGLTDGSQCSECGLIISDLKKIEALGHKWDSGKATKAATCEKAGVKTYTCQNDKGHTKTETIKATGHKDSDSNYKCDTCDKLLCTDHTSVTVKGKEATCTEAGLTDGSKCSKCGKVLKEQKKIEATVHNIVIDKAVAATCTQSGLTEGKHCSACEVVIEKQKSIEAKGHTVEVKLSDKGEEIVYCSVCNEILQINQPICPKGHTSGAAVKENVAAATCEKTGSYDEVVYCTECKKEISRTQKTLSALGHNWDGGKVTTAATCEKNGIITYTCRNDKSHAKTEVVKATGHSFSAGKCTVCNADDPNDTPSTPDNPFVDIEESDWFFSAVLWAVKQGITGGTSANMFSPNDLCTREQVVTFLWASAGKPEPKSTYNPFTDVNQNDWFYKPVLWAVENGITGGITATQFGTGQTCTRAQVAAFLYAYKGKPAFTPAQSPFSDVSSGDWFFNAVMWAVENGITGGIGNSLFGHGQPCTRGQIALFLYKSDPIEGTPQKPDNETVDGNKVAYAAYIPVVEQAISEEVFLPQSQGMLYDMDHDGIQELMMIHEKAEMEDDVCVGVNMVCSVFDVKNGSIIAKLDEMYLNSTAGAPESYVGIVEFEGNTLFLVHSTNAGDESAYTSNILLNPLTFGQVLNQETDEYGSEIDGVRYIDMIDDGHGSMSEFMKSGMSLSELLTHLKKNQ